jgi:hypothetical protein
LAEAAVSERAFWRWTSLAIVVAALIALALPGACVPVLVAQLWLGITVGVLSAFWPPPSGPDAAPSLEAKGGVR